MKSGSILSEDTFEQIDDAVNNKLEQISLVAEEGVSIIPASIVNQEYLKYNDYDLMIKGIEQATINARR